IGDARAIVGMNRVPKKLRRGDELERRQPPNRIRRRTDVREPAALLAGEEDVFAALGDLPKALLARAELRLDASTDRKIAHRTEKRVAEHDRVEPTRHATSVARAKCRFAAGAFLREGGGAEAAQRLCARLEERAERRADDLVFGCADEIARDAIHIRDDVVAID